jgi:hypothetical protein
MTAAGKRSAKSPARARKPAAEAKPRTQFDREDQPLFLVMGGEVADPMGARFADPARIDLRGVFASYEEAFAVWRGAAQETVDNALVKYVIVRLR